MSLWPITVSLAGVAQALDHVLSDVTIRHGRQDVFEDAQPAYAALTFLGVTRAQSKAFQVGKALAITAQDGATTVARFTGTVSDAELDDDRLLVTAVGPRSTFWRYTVGVGAWPAESWSARVTRAFSEAGLSSSLVLEVGAFNPGLAARAASPVALNDYLPDLLETVGAACVDLPDGKVLVQAVDSRSFASPLTLASADVVYAPPWVQALDICNSASVTYAGGGVASQIDAGSIAAFGTYPKAITTEIVSSSDAALRATALVGRRAYPRWTMTRAPVLKGYHAIRVGRTMIVHDLPDASPYPSWQPVIEGWEDSIQADEWTMALALSDPVISGLSLPWVDAPGTWATVTPTTAWKDALTPGDLVPL